MQSVPQNMHCQMVGLMNQCKYEWQQSWLNICTIHTAAPKDWGKLHKFSDRIETQSKPGALPLPLIWQIS